MTTFAFASPRDGAALESVGAVFFSGPAVLRERVVQARRGHALGRERARLGDLLVDDRRELLDGPRADEPPPVDEEMRRARSPEAVRHLAVGVDRLVVRLLGDGLLHLRDVERQVARDPLEVRVGEALRREQRVVCRPEPRVPFLGTRLERQLGGRLGAIVEGKRRVLPHDADLVAVLGTQLPERLLGAPAERALVVAKLDDRDRRVLAATHRARADGHLVDVGVGSVGLFLLRGLVVRVGRLGVDLVLRRPLGDERARLAHGRRDDLLERLRGLRARDHRAIDEERGRAVHADLLGDLEVAIDLRAPRLRAGRVGERGRVHAGVAGPSGVGVRAEALLVGERARRELPERRVPTDRTCSLGGFGRGARVCVEGER
jgi:hypothetical protein